MLNKKHFPVQNGHFIFNQKYCLCLVESTVILSHCLHHNHRVIKYWGMKNEHTAYAWKFHLARVFLMLWNSFMRSRKILFWFGFCFVLFQYTSISSVKLYQKRSSWSQFVVTLYSVYQKCLFISPDFEVSVRFNH